MDELTTRRWAALRDRRNPHQLVVEPVTEGMADALIGIEPDGRLHFLLCVASEPSSLPPDLQSIEVRVLEGDERIWLDVSARSHNEVLFTMIANQILTAVRTEHRDPATSLESTLEELRAALRPLALELGVTEQIGLFGELWVLSNILLPIIGARAVHFWSGPQRERHDFAGSGAHIEVKTTTRSDQRHEISRLDQLRAPAGKRLVMVSIALERSIAGEATIADLVDEIVQKLGAEGRAIAAFEGSIKDVGWHNGLRQTGSLLRFTLRDAHVFEVVDSFPRLPDDYVPPRGVIAIRYTIDVTSRASLSRDEVMKILLTM